MVDTVKATEPVRTGSVGKKRRYDDQSGKRQGGQKRWAMKTPKESNP